MRRLTGRRPRPVHPLRRLHEERGAIAVMLALLMPILFGLAAIAIDVAGVWSARQQVENGADAAVLAVAMDCAANNCGDIKSTAEDAFWANNRAAKLTDLGPGEGWVAVNGREVSVTQKKPWVVNHFFAGALGQGKGELSVQSYARWAPASRGRADAPVGISWCVYKSAITPGGNAYGSDKGSPGTHATATIPLETSFGPGNCPGPSGTVPNGTALTTPTTGECRTTSEWKQSVTASTKSFAALGSGCDAARLSSLVGGTIVLPVWDSVTGAGTAGASFRVHGYAAFRVTRYVASGPALEGYFVYAGHQTDDTTPPTTTAPDLGARAVFLDHQ
ncbi:TadE/TadG family type IV pilus assembly protein [Blastococcus sp. SYSU D01042]